MMTIKLWRRMLVAIALTLSTATAQAGVTVVNGVVAITDGIFETPAVLTYNFNLLAGPYTATLTDTNVLFPFQALSLEVKTGGGTSLGTVSAAGTVNSFPFTSLAAGPFQAIVSGTPSALIPPFSTFGVTIAPVPEPEIWAMMVVGMGLLGFRLRRKGLQPA
jgi:hypothetical protein